MTRSDMHFRKQKKQSKPKNSVLVQLFICALLGIVIGTSIGKSLGSSFILIGAVLGLSFGLLIGTYLTNSN